MRPIGRDSAGRLGRRHRNKYAIPVPRARVWCNAVNGLNEYCKLMAPHAGPHVFAPGARR
jgi:hypothetical protein